MFCAAEIFPRRSFYFIAVNSALYDTLGNENPKPALGLRRRSHVIKSDPAFTNGFSFCKHRSEIA